MSIADVARNRTNIRLTVVITINEHPQVKFYAPEGESSLGRQMGVQSIVIKDQQTMPDGSSTQVTFLDDDCVKHHVLVKNDRIIHPHFYS